MAKLIDKDKAIAKCRKMKRKVIWLDEDGVWHCSTDRQNTPNFAVEVIDVE